jgi:carbamoyltransferase
LTTILGLNAFHGDAAAALVVDGILIAAVEEERFNRVKHCAGFPAAAAAWCLEDAGIRPSDIDHIAIGRDVRANAGAKLRYSLRHPPSPAYVVSRLKNAANVRDVKSRVAMDLGVSHTELRADIHHVEHHLAHASSAFYVSPFEEAAVLTVDGFGDYASTMLAHGEGTNLTVLDRVLFPHSLGLLYTAVTQWLGFPHYGDEGKVMGLAPYGDPERFAGKVRQIIDLDGPLFRLNLRYFSHHSRGVAMTWEDGSPAIGRVFSSELERLLGPARVPKSEVTTDHHDVAAALQRVLEEAYLHVVATTYARTQSPRLCLAGGVALNAVANGMIRQQTAFDEVYVQPAAGDSGTAVGAAFRVWHETLGRKRSYVMRHAYTGPGFVDADYVEALDRAGLTGELLPDDELFTTVAARIAEGDVVGWFQGRMEFGPRALGHRSIVADPRRADMKDILNARIKHREPFRPFAPSILAERAGDWFEQDYTSPFMVMVYKTRLEKRAAIPAVNHVDDTGRLQTVERDVEPRYYALIEAFGNLTGVPILLNTSFNENEPIVTSPRDAVDCFLKTKMDLLVLGNRVVRRPAPAP